MIRIRFLNWISILNDFIRAVRVLKRGAEETNAPSRHERISSLSFYRMAPSVTIISDNHVEISLLVEMSSKHRNGGEKKKLKSTKFI